MAHIPLILQYFIMLKCCDIRYEDWESGGGLQVIRCKRSWQGGGAIQRLSHSGDDQTLDSPDLYTVK